MTRQVAGVVLCVFLAFLAVADAKERPKSRNRGKKSNNNRNAAAAAAKARAQQQLQRAQAQEAAAQRVLAAAQGKGANATAELQRALGGLQQARVAFESAQTDVRDLEKQLRDIEEEILDEQEEGTEFAQLEDLVEAAREVYKKEETRVLNSPELKSRIAGAAAAADYAAAVARFRSDALNSDIPLANAKQRLKTVGDDLQRVRAKLFQEDEQWRQIAEELTDARKEMAAANAQAQGSGLSKLGPLGDIRDANKAAAAARAALAQAHSVIQRSQSQLKTASSKSSKPANKKK